MDTSSSLPNALDLSGHLSYVSRNRFASPLKDIFKYMGTPGMISLAGANVSIYPPSVNVQHGEVPPTSDLLTLSIPKVAPKRGELDLSSVLQYGDCSGLPELRTFLHKFTQDVYQPAYGNWEIQLNEGNTASWTKVVRLLCDPGEHILLEEFTFPSAMGPWVPQDCKGVPVKMDGRGLRADDLEHVLSTWEATHPGIKRPHVLYTIPCAQNPTGSTMDAERKQEVYRVCQQFDVVIIEDSPYEALQFRPFEITPEPAAPVEQNGEEFRQALVPSFLRFDTDGRVIRLESFSKTLAPGSRLGYFVANPLFTERLLRGTEVESQTPSGWSQSIVSRMLHTWGQDGYLEWLSRLRDAYELRRNIMCAALAKRYVALPAEKYAAAVPGCEGVALYPLGTDPASIQPDQLPVASFVPPAGGMFLWIKYYVSAAPGFQKLVEAGDADPEATFMHDMWTALAENLVLLTPGSYYVPFSGKDKVTTTERDAERGIGFFRFAFSYGDRDEMEEGIRRVEEVTKRLWQY
ncbi:hypothetical protein Rhopal_003791-T1 [Rhodotorula paludigena]|uniref:Aminotransferase class I/classII large domain-containing protein n=1 Tax=Rhodotorula paludigena TaxID=86838 RepID=A0AAV5GN41_9BASI|nr:hypothetical protein Rhopal_003791-T1 [Rhodotorula paludigena]